ncbi:hypothetical protein DRP77_00165 [Candidatus Poribacteria bacterium]|nr:MAG: hypothetical protein DRP77_00165 [Candidatus Poribacteria bacterium]
MKKAEAKPIVFSRHSQVQMSLRGATEQEVIETILKGQWLPAKYDRFRSKRRFNFGRPSPITGVVYRFKDVEAIFKEEEDQIVVITVKVYYSNEEGVT